ncbi:MAG TPA: hypothetical protein VF692_02700 [Pyrinomonadaceae bacterium]
MVSFLTTLLRSGLFFGFFMAIVYSCIKGWETGIEAGLLGGILFGLGMALFVKYQSNKFTQTRPLISDENIVKEGPANHLLKLEGVGGWIYLIDSRLIFVSHKFNIKNHELSIPLSEISIAESGKTLGILSNRLILNLKNGQIEKFIVNDAKNWANHIEKII